LTSFTGLRSRHLHELDEAAWRDYGPAMAALPSDADPATRGPAPWSGRSWLSVEQGAGRQARQKVPGYKIPAPARQAADDSFSEGYGVVAHRDSAWINRPAPGPQESQKGKSGYNL
jgi:hypothetical protein